MVAKVHFFTKQTNTYVIFFYFSRRFFRITKKTAPQSAMLREPFLYSSLRNAPPSDISHQPTYIWLLISSYTILPQIQEIFAIRSKLNKIDQNRFVPSTQSLTIAQKKEHSSHEERPI